MDMPIKLTQQQSSNINLLKGLSIVLVVIIHADVRSLISKYMSLSPAVDVYFETLTRILVDNAVPMFYFISGFLFFLNKNTFTNKFKSRFRTLVVPYLFWCVVGFLIPFVIQRILGLEYLYSGNQLKLLKDFTGVDYLRMFWNLREGAPILSTLWFLRDLIVYVALTPIIAVLCKYMRWCFPVALLIVYFSLDWSLPGFSTRGFCWFAMGAFFSLKRINVWEKIEKINTKVILVLWGLFTILAVISYLGGFCYNEYMKGYRIVHFVTIYHVLALLSAKFEMRFLYKIALASFFIYVFHEPWMGYIAQIGMRVIEPHGLFIFLSPIILTMFTIGFSYFAYWILLQTVPRFLNVITGARSK